MTKIFSESRSLGDFFTVQLPPDTWDLNLILWTEVFIATEWLGKLITISSKHFEVLRGHLLFQQDSLLLACTPYCLWNNEGLMKNKTCPLQRVCLSSLHLHENMIFFKKVISMKSLIFIQKDNFFKNKELGCFFIS